MKLNIIKIIERIGFVNGEKDINVMINSIKNNTENKGNIIKKKSNSFSTIVTQTNDAMDGFRGAVVNSFEKNYPYYIDVSFIMDSNKSLDEIRFELLKKDTTYLNNILDKENNDKFINNTTNEIIDSVNLKVSVENNVLKYKLLDNDPINLINGDNFITLDKIQFDLHDEIKNYIIKYNFIQNINETPPYSLFLQDNVFELKSLKLKETNFNYIPIINYDNEKVFAKTNFTLNYTAPLKIKNKIQSYSDLIQDQNSEIENFSNIKNIEKNKDINKKELKPDLKKIVENLQKKTNKIKNEIECKKNSYHCCGKTHFSNNLYYKNNSTQIQFQLELVYLNNNVDESKLKNPSSKIGYFTSDWFDKSKIASIETEKLFDNGSEKNKKIYIYIDNTISNSNFNIINDSGTGSEPISTTNSSINNVVIHKAIDYWKRVFLKAQEGKNVKYIFEEVKDDPFSDSTFRYKNSITLIDNHFPVYGVASCGINPFNGGIFLSNATFNSTAHSVNFDLESSSFIDKINKINYDIIIDDHELFNNFESDKFKKLRKDIFENDNWDWKKKMVESQENAVIYKKILSKLIEDNLIKTITHEIGHCLGLRHNFAACTTTDGVGCISIMDYVFYNNGKFTIFTSIKEEGLYDIFAIKYGYTDANILDLTNDSKNKILYVSDYAQIFFPTIGMNDFENTIDDDSSISKNFRDALVYWYWDNNKQVADLKKKKKFLSNNGVKLFKDENEYFELKYYFSATKSLNYRIEILLAFNYPFIYKIIDNNLEPTIINIDEQVKLIDVLLDYYLKKDPFELEASTNAKRKMLNLQSGSGTDGDNFFIPLIHNLNIIDYYQAMSIFLYYLIGFERGLSPLDNYITFFYDKDASESKKNPYLKIIRKMILLTLICGQYIFTKERFSFNYLEKILNNDIDTEFRQLLSNYNSDISRLLEPKIKLVPANIIKSGVIIASSVLFISQIFKGQKKIGNLLSNMFFIYLIVRLSEPFDFKKEDQPIRIN